MARPGNWVDFFFFFYSFLSSPPSVSPLCLASLLHPSLSLSLPPHPRPRPVKSALADMQHRSTVLLIFTLHCISFTRFKGGETNTGIILWRKAGAAIWAQESIWRLVMMVVELAGLAGLIRPS